LGLALQITKNSSTIYRGNFGLRNKEKNLPVNNNTYFRSASLSKNVAAVGLYLLIE
jgi:CubicO group peptidase (beta-lactamase class C family)